MAFDFIMNLVGLYSKHIPKLTKTLPFDGIENEGPCILPCSSHL
jgi:hypothetical protein